MSVSINTISVFVGIATGIIALIEGIIRLAKLIKPDGSDDAKKSLAILVSVGQWVFLVATTLGLASVALATLGAYLGANGESDINDQFRNSIGLATAFSLLYGVFWGSVIRPWLMKK